MNESRPIDFSSIRAVTFDAGGTLIQPWPSVGHVYAEAARSHLGAAPDPELLNRQFRQAWKNKSAFDYSRPAWLELVKNSFTGVCSDPELFFDRLYRRFGEPDTWQIYEDVFPALQGLRSLGLRLGVISNWDERLRPLLDRLGLAKFFEQIIVSMEAGVTKPAQQIFQKASERLNLQPKEVLHVGDSEVEDSIGPKAIGMPALLLRRGPSETAKTGLLSSLGDLTSLFQGR